MIQQDTSPARIEEPRIADSTDDVAPGDLRHVVGGPFQKYDALVKDGQRENDDEVNVAHRNSRDLTQSELHSASDGKFEPLQDQQQHKLVAVAYSNAPFVRKSSRLDAVSFLVNYVASNIPSRPKSVMRSVDFCWWRIALRDIDWRSVKKLSESAPEDAGGNANWQHGAESESESSSSSGTYDDLAGQQDLNSCGSGFNEKSMGRSAELSSDAFQVTRRPCRFSSCSIGNDMTIVRQCRKNIQ